MKIFIEDTYLTTLTVDERKQQLCEMIDAFKYEYAMAKDKDMFLIAFVSTIVITFDPANFYSIVDIAKRLSVERSKDTPPVM